MGILNFFFGRDKNDSPDVLGRYPEYMQVPALPERRYLKTSRLLALCIFLNLALMMLIAGGFAYYADRIDVNIANRQNVNLYSIDSSRQTLVPAEYASKKVAALDLFAESILRDYIKTRHTVVWENSVMTSRWGLAGPIAVFSNRKKVYAQFQMWADNLLSESRAKKFVRDVHLYELKQVKNNFWEGVFDTFDMPIPDAYDPICNCSTNSKECISCKAKYTSRRLRYKVYIRAGYRNMSEASREYRLRNPLGFQIDSYSLLYMPIKEGETFWRIPADLKPDL